MSSNRSDELGQVRTPRPSQVSFAEFDFACPPTSEGHNFFVRTPFRVLLDYMESPLSQESIYIYLVEIETRIKLRKSIITKTTSTHE